MHLEAGGALAGLELDIALQMLGAGLGTGHAAVDEEGHALLERMLHIIHGRETMTVLVYRPWEYETRFGLETFIR
jgi:hypothetical protein